MDALDKFKDILAEKDLTGLNVTIPFKETVIPYLDSLSPEAEQIGAVNTIKLEGGKAVGHNTDWLGFRESFEPLLKPNYKRALILGTGGAAKAVGFALRSLRIGYRYVSRSDDELLYYKELGKKIFMQYHVVINCTPLGTYPKAEECPPLNYDYFTPNHLAYDLVYNPEKTLFLENAQKHGAMIKNGREMLERQAEKAWEIWNS
jgi:shikimate dehydrogenase